MTYKWIDVTLDGYGKVRAYADTSVVWNGFVCPYFKADDVPAINDALHEFCEDSLVYDAESDAFDCMNEFDERVERFVGRDVDGMRLYPIGNGCWIWSETKE